MDAHHQTCATLWSTEQTGSHAQVSLLVLYFARVLGRVIDPGRFYPDMELTLKKSLILILILQITRIRPDTKP